MIIFVMKILSRPGKSLELRQTLDALIEPTRKDRGCLSHNVYQDIEHDDTLILVGIWENRDLLNKHLCSDRFTVLMGAANLMSQPPEISIGEVTVCKDWDAIKAVRG